MDTGENTESRKYLTTTQAARMLSVSPDTVLKWVRAGKLRSHRTLGGHFRICVEDVHLQGDRDNAAPKQRKPADSPAFQYCWEYFPSEGSAKPECRECIAFRSRARRCYELRDLPEGLGCMGLNCTPSCKQCDYFKLVREQGPNVLVLGEKGTLLKDMADPDGGNDIHVTFVDCEYDCALVIQEFRPDYIVVDCRLGRKRTADICAKLMSDARVPVARIILASRSRKLGDYCDQKILGWIKKPFTIRQLRDCIEEVAL
ncbi:MAG: helix-turn-helix domain-containing protein [Pseudomonadota bacterium]